MIEKWRRDADVKAAAAAEQARRDSDPAYAAAMAAKEAADA